MALKDTKLVIFDMDGLLLDTERLIVEHWDRFALRQGLDRDRIREVCMASIGINLPAVRRLVSEKLGPDFPYEAYSERVKESIAEELKGGPMPVKKGAFELLEYLKSIRMPAVVASSSPRAAVTAELRDAGLLPYFAAVFGGEDAARSKPAPDLFLRAASSIGADPAACLVFEDSHNGIRAASAAGMMSIMVPDLQPADREMQTLYTARAEDLATAAEMLRQVFSPVAGALNG